MSTHGGQQYGRMYTWVYNYTSTYRPVIKIMNFPQINLASILNLLVVIFKRGSVPLATVHPRFRCFARVFPAKRLELKSLKNSKRHTKSEELRPRGPQFLSLRLSLKAL